jgi:hypothetical protein
MTEYFVCVRTIALWSLRVLASCYIKIATLSKFFEAGFHIDIFCVVTCFHCFVS